MERDANELCIFLDGLAPWARPGCLLKEMPKHVRGHALCLCDCHRQHLSDIMYREPVMILTTCSSTSSPNVEFRLHDVLWSRWAGGIHTEVIVMLTQRGMNRQWTAKRVSGSLHHWHVQLILTWQGRNDDQEGRSPTARLGHCTSCFADPCEFPKCGNLDCIISGSGGLRSRSPLIKC